MPTDSEEAICQRLQTIIADQLGVAHQEVQPGAHFVEDLGADSLDLVELIMAVEEEFHTDIPDEKLDTIQSMEDLVSFLQEASP